MGSKAGDAGRGDTPQTFILNARTRLLVPSPADYLRRGDAEARAGSGKYETLLAVDGAFAIQIELML